jgi:hypothetical protein
MNFVDRYLPYFRQQPIARPLLALLPFQSLFTESSGGDQLLASPPFSSALTAPCLLCCMFLFSSLFIIQVFFLGGWVCPWDYAGLSQWCLWEYHVMLICSPVGLLDVSQAGLELAYGDAGALLFFQCNVAWRSFVWAGGSGCWSLDSSWFFFSAKCGSSISARFFIYRVHTVCFCTLVAILDPSLAFKSIC